MNRQTEPTDLKVLSANLCGGPQVMQRPRVWFYTAPANFDHPGGGEVQLRKTAAALAKLGVDARMYRGVNEPIGDGDWLHLFGTLPECLEVAQGVRDRNGVRIALSPISWYDPWVSWHLESTAWRRCRAIVGWATRRACPAFPSWRRQLIQIADLLLPNSHAEAFQLQQLFGVPHSRIVVVPNGVDERFLFADPEHFQRQFKCQDFVLVPGRIEPRKNQLSVLRALWGLGVPMVILGDPHPAHRAYAEACRREAGPGVLFVRHLSHDSPMLASAYGAARVVVLASWFETPGLAALEGALAGAQVIVTEHGGAREYFGHAARYVRPDDWLGIRSAVRDSYLAPRSDILAGLVRHKYLWDHVAQRTLDAYQHVADLSTGYAKDQRPLAAAA